jgi:hypothetical protein
VSDLLKLPRMIVDSLVRPELHPNADFGICIMNALNIKRGYWKAYDQSHSSSSGISPMGSTPGSMAYVSSAAGPSTSNSINGKNGNNNNNPSSSNHSGSNISGGPLRESPGIYVPDQVESNVAFPYGNSIAYMPWSGPVNGQRVDNQGQGASIDTISPPLATSKQNSDPFAQANYTSEKAQSTSNSNAYESGIAMPFGSTVHAETRGFFGFMPPSSTGVAVENQNTGDLSGLEDGQAGLTKGAREMFDHASSVNGGKGAPFPAGLFGGK